MERSYAQRPLSVCSVRGFARVVGRDVPLKTIDRVMEPVLYQEAFEFFIDSRLGLLHVRDKHAARSSVVSRRFALGTGAHSRPRGRMVINLGR